MRYTGFRVNGGKTVRPRRIMLALVLILAIAGLLGPAGQPSAGGEKSLLRAA